MTRAACLMSIPNSQFPIPKDQFQFERLGVGSWKLGVDFGVPLFPVRVKTSHTQ